MEPSIVDNPTFQKTESICEPHKANLHDILVERGIDIATYNEIQDRLYHIQKIYMMSEISNIEQADRKRRQLDRRIRCLAVVCMVLVASCACLLIFCVNRPRERGDTCSDGDAQRHPPLLLAHLRRCEDDLLRLTRTASRSSSPPLPPVSRMTPLQLVSKLWDVWIRRDSEEDRDGSGVCLRAAAHE